jgi:hypothetical protein
MFFVGAAKTFPQITRGARWGKFRHHINITIHKERYTSSKHIDAVALLINMRNIFLSYA